MRGRGATGSGLILPLMLLLLPPAGNIFWELHTGRRSRERLGNAGLTAEDPEAGTRISTLRQLLLDKERELEILRGWSLEEPRHVPLLTDVVHTGDLSPRRHALWLWGTGFQGVTSRTSVAFRGALVGRVDRVFEGRRLARVMSLMDPYFRVKFRYGKQSDSIGFLWGTDRADTQGRPFLEIRLLKREVRFQQGEPVFTAGGDGFFPSGLLIGRLVRVEESQQQDRRFQVLAEYRPDALAEVVLLVDRASMEVLSLPDGPGEKEIE